MSYNDIYRHYMEFMMFGGKMSKNVKDNRKLALETFKNVLMGPSMFGRVLCVNIR